MTKYKPLPRVKLTDRKWPDNEITKAPIWCSVDLRDGNQSLAIPMSINNKIKMFQLLVEIGFKEIEVGFPAASQIEFDFIQKLINDKLIPDDVIIQVLTQAREHLIKKTFGSIKGAKNVIIHLYNSTSPLQRKITFSMSKDQIKKIALDGTKLIKKLLPTLPDTIINLQYSPESFSDTEEDYALEVCENVMDIWEPTEKNKIIINLPHTVEWFAPNIYADKVEWICKNIKDKNKTIISIHTHNDRGTSIAASELAVLAGAERVEGTLFGNGERTGNMDIVTMALNMFTQGIDPKLDFTNIPYIKKIYEECTKMEVPPRQPYSGELVFTAFSGSHQDAIKKGMDNRLKINNKNEQWEVPYLLIDPKDIGRSYKAIIRINSQSGKGGIAYILSREYGLELPKNMHPEVGMIINKISDKLGRELNPEEIYNAFFEHFINRNNPLELINFNCTTNKDNDNNACMATVKYNNKTFAINGQGNGPIDAFVHGMNNQGWDNFQVIDFHEQSLGTGSDTEAISYIQIKTHDGIEYWGAGIDTNISLAGIKSLVNAYNRSLNNKAFL